MNEASQNLPTVFKFEGKAEVRTITQDGEPWFVAKDICEVLGISNSRDAIRTLDDDERGVEKVDTLGGEQEMSIISESGMYTLVIRSNKPQARKFRKWITSEVLPSIRKTGMYANRDSANQDPDQIIYPVQLAAMLNIGYQDVYQIYHEIKGELIIGEDTLSFPLRFLSPGVQKLVNYARRRPLLSTSKNKPGRPKNISIGTDPTVLFKEIQDVKHSLLVIQESIVALSEAIQDTEEEY